MLSSEAILELKKAGYLVHVICDQDPVLYAWIHKAGATQRDVKERQPYRLSEAQAWDDCQAYASGDVPSTPNPDWVQ